MKIWKQAVLFYIGGMIYAALELCWRGYTHGSMFFLGGLCFVLLGQLKRRFPALSLAGQTAAGACIVTVLELGCGLLVNREYQVWDYRNMPLNYHGQICLPFFLLWIPISLAAILLYGFMDSRLTAVTSASL